MTRDFESTPWWELDPEERPVPLGSDQQWHAADEAELIVNAEREAIIREDTEPTIVTLAQLAASAEPTAPRRGIEMARSTALVAGAALLVGCVVMFTVGWHQGRDRVEAKGSGPVTRTTSYETPNDSLKDSNIEAFVATKGGGA